MNYCTNCGKESGKKICEHCGSKRGTTNLYCGWCGTELNANAVICTNCHESVAKPSKLKKIISIALPAILFVLSFIMLTQGAPGALPFFLIAAIIALPFVKGLIMKYTHGKKALRTVLTLARIAIIIALFVVGMNTMTSIVEQQKRDSIDIYKDQATAAAEVVFHEQHKLKNEASYVLNDSKVLYSPDEPYKGDEYLRLVSVTLDYSAQNSFGGMTRDTTTINIVFDYSTGYYYRTNGTQIVYSAE